MARTPDLEVQGSSLARRVVSLDKELYCTLSLSTQVYKCWGVTLRWTSIPSRGGAGGGEGHNTRVYLYHFYLLITTND